MYLTNSENGHDVCRCGNIAILIHSNNGELFQAFDKGDRVRLDVDMSKAKKLQKRHGGWNKKMKKVTVFLCIKHTPMYTVSVLCCHLTRIFMFTCTQYHRYYEVICK